MRPASTVYYIHLTGHQGPHTARERANITQECNYSPLTMKAWGGNHFNNAVCLSGIASEQFCESKPHINWERCI